MDAAVQELRRVHETALAEDWHPRVDHLNRQLGLSGANAFTLSLPSLPPMWFNGDVEAIQPGKWTLVISLNHQVGGEQNAPAPDGLWDWCRTHNRNFWYTRFFRPLVQVASRGLSEIVADEREYATVSMVFVELCPYASPGFTWTDELADIARTEEGFRTAARVRDILIQKARPGLILVNGVPTLDAFEASYGPDMENWRASTYPSPSRPSRNLWHMEGWVRHQSDKIPVVGFPFLRRQGTHNSNVEVHHLGLAAQRLASSG